MTANPWAELEKTYETEIAAASVEATGKEEQHA